MMSQQGGCCQQGPAFFYFALNNKSIDPKGNYSGLGNESEYASYVLAICSNNEHLRCWL